MSARKHTPPRALVGFSGRMKALFEQDYDRAAAVEPAYRQAGREYVALGYALALTTMWGWRRRRRPPVEPPILQPPY